jgi:hypothetical protein
MEEKLGISVQPLSQENARDPSLRAVMRSGGGLVCLAITRRAVVSASHR